jgi:hypothetical protein
LTAVHPFKESKAEGCANGYANGYAEEGIAFFFYG